LVGFKIIRKAIRAISANVDAKWMAFIKDHPSLLSYIKVNAHGTARSAR